MPQSGRFSRPVDDGGAEAQIPGMRRQGGGFGFVMLLVVLAIVFFLAMRNFESVAPEAQAIQQHNAQRRAQDGAVRDAAAPPASSSASADSWTPSPPSRPNLDTMDQKTTQHSNEVQNALSQTN